MWTELEGIFINIIVALLLVNEIIRLAESLFGLPTPFEKWKLEREKKRLQVLGVLPSYHTQVAQYIAGNHKKTVPNHDEDFKILLKKYTRDLGEQMLLGRGQQKIKARYYIDLNAPTASDLDVMADHSAEAWVSDCYSAQMKAPSGERQLCVAHQLRNLQAVVDRYPASFWPRAMQALFRSAIHSYNQRDHLSPPEFQAQIQQIERLCDRLLERPLEQLEAKRLLKRYHKYRDCLFVFLHRIDVSPTNNVSERNLRPSVVHRKVMGCFRSGWGARAYAALASVIATAALKGASPFATIQSLLGTPSLPLPTGV